MCANLASKHSSWVHICAMEYWQLVTTCTYAKLSQINTHNRTCVLFGLPQHTTPLAVKIFFKQIAITCYRYLATSLVCFLYLKMRPSERTQGLLNGGN